MNFKNFLRLRWRISTLLTVLLLLLIIVQCNGISPQPDDGDGADYVNDGDIGGEENAGKEDIYDPSQLQQEVEAEEHRNFNEMNDMDMGMAMEMESQTKIPIPESMQKMSDNHIGQHLNEPENAVEHDNEKKQKQHRTPSSEEYYDDERPKEDDLKHRLHHSLPQTTIIPEYIRQAKAERTLINDNDDKKNNDASRIDITETKEKSNSQSSKNKPEHNEPQTMKLYQANPVDSLDEEEIIRKYLEKKQQLLPRQEIMRSFNAALDPMIPNHSDESHYDDYYDDDTREQNNDELPIHHVGKHKYDVILTRRTTKPPMETTQHPPSFETDLVTRKQQEIYAGSNTTTTNPSTTSSTTTTENAPNQDTISTETPLSQSMDSTSTTVSPTTTNPTIPYGTTLPTPLALGPFITTAGLTTTVSTISDIPDPLLVPVTTTTTTTSTETTTTTSTISTIPTTIRPGGKQGKQINISRRKLQPHEKLRNYIEDAYIRMPLAVIVDPSAESLEKTKTLWRDALRTNFNIKIVLVSLNASGAPAAYTFNNTRQFLAGLNSIKEHTGGDAFIGIVHASELVPYDSAVFISTASLSPHTELVQDAAITLLKKRIRLYLLWYGERALSENETQEAVGGILGEVAIRSGGDILHIVGSENSQELDGGNTLILVADAFRGTQDIEIPVDSTLSSLHVKIDAPIYTATLETPNGVLNLKKFVKLRTHIFNNDKSLDAYVPLTKLRKAVVLTLKVVPEDVDNEYTVFVRADRKADHFLEELIKRFDTYIMERFSYNPTRHRDNRLQSITAAVAAMFPTHDNLKFPEDDDFNKTEEINSNSTETEPKNDVETFSEIEIHKNTNDIDITEKEAGPKTVANKTYESQQQYQTRNVLQSSVTKIEMGAQSQILVAPGMMSELYFEVTNTRNEPVFHNIQVVDERRYLLRLIPQSVFLRAGETSTVTVTVLVPQGTPQGTIDRITFTCHGSGTASLSLNLKVNTGVDIKDTTPPTVSWTFGSRCEYIAVDSPNCAERFWTMDITAQDWETGILRLQSTPTNRLLYRNSYTVGSTEPLKATYAATCCEPKVTLLAYDIASNQRSYNIDVRDIVLTEASIAAIVLGALLLLLLIVLAIWCIVWCCRRRKVVLDLPTYRSHSTRSME